MTRKSVQGGTVRLLAIVAGGAFALFGQWTLVPALADPVSSGTQTSTFAVMRNDTQIGSHTISIDRNGANTTIQSVTHVEVKLGFLTVYRFEQQETEHWSDGKFLAMQSTTDDNGTLHKAVATTANGAILVKSGDGHSCQMAAGTLPLSPWNFAVLAQRHALDPRDGNLVNVSVSDRGEDTLLLHGHAERAHHYVISSGYSQEVWYDDSGRLVQLEFIGSDGSAIFYKLV